MASDGPPWTVGSNCNVTLRHPDVNGDVAAGFYVKPDSFRALLPKVWYRGTNLSLVLPAGPIAAGQRVGACGKTGFQAWAHLHFELRYRGPAEGMTAAYWGGRLSYEAQSDRYADPYTVLRVLEGAGVYGAEEDLVARLALTEHELRVTQIDRERNYQLKMEMEACLRRLEGTKRVRKGTTERLIKKVIG